MVDAERRRDPPVMDTRQGHPAPRRFCLDVDAAQQIDYPPIAVSRILQRNGIPLCRSRRSACPRSGVAGRAR
jgi:hypothetical protein